MRTQVTTLNNEFYSLIKVDLFINEALIKTLKELTNAGSISAS